MYQQETRLSSPFHDSIMMTCTWVRNKTTDLKLWCATMTINSGVDVRDKLVGEYACTRSTRHWTLTVFLNLILLVWIQLYYACWSILVGNRRKIKICVSAFTGRKNGQDHTWCDSLIPGMALWKQNLLTRALAAAVAFEILSLWIYALSETMVPLPETVLKIVLRWMSERSANLRSFRAFFNFGKSQKFQGAKSGE